MSCSEFMSCVVGYGGNAVVVLFDLLRFAASVMDGYGANSRKLMEVWGRASGACWCYWTAHHMDS